MNKVELPLSRILSSWESRARVRCYSLNAMPVFEVDKLDFLPAWLPFGEHPNFVNLGDELKSKLLSIGWLLYNQATLDIEHQLVIPFCLQLMQSDNTFSKSYQWRQMLFQTITDESYHVQLTEHASEITRQHRSLYQVPLPTSYFLLKLEHSLSHHQAPWKKALITLAACVVTEIVIGEHLGVVGNCHDDRLQKMVVDTTKTHMMDESVHSHIFDKILRESYVNLSMKEQRFFQRILPEVISWFMFGRLEAWKRVLPSLAIPRVDDMIADSESSMAHCLTYDIAKLKRFSDEFGLPSLEDQVMTFRNRGDRS